MTKLFERKYPFLKARFLRQGGGQLFKVAQMEFTGQKYIVDVYKAGHSSIGPILHLERGMLARYRSPELSLILPTQRRELLSAPSRKVGFTGVLVTTAEAGPLTYHLNLGGGVLESPKRSLGTVGSLLWAIAGEFPLTHELSAVVEFRGESVRGSLPDNTVLGGLAWKSPWGIKFDAAGFGGLSQGSNSWGVTFGLAYSFKAIPWLGK